MREIRIAQKSFEEWAELAREDPAAFEKMRQAAIDGYIQGLPSAQQERMRRLQWRIDQERRMARTPMKACLRISRMMWDSILGRGGLQSRFVELGLAIEKRSDAGMRNQASLDRADVLSFARPVD